MIEARDHGFRNCRAADGQAQILRLPVLRLAVHRLQDAKPDGRHAGGDGDPLVDEQIQQALRIQMRTGIDLTCADQGCAVRHTPGISVEHGDYGQHGITGR